MKKLIGLVFAFIYLFTTSSLTHASTMGFFSMSHNVNHTVSHCHSDSDSSSTSSKQTHNMNCCELFSSNQYSQTKLELKTSLKNLPLHISQEIFNKPRLSTLQTGARPDKFGNFRLNFSPGPRNPDIKYHKFSDLSAGIIVSLS